MTPEQIISDFKRQKLRVDFIEMVLVQNKLSDDKISYKGKGYIEQTETDVLTFKLYAHETRNTDWSTDFTRLSKTRSGELFSREDFYTLSGTASDGSVWNAENILPACNWHLGNPDPIVHGDLSSVGIGTPVPNARSLSLYFFEKVDLAVPIDQVMFKAAGCEFHIVGDDDGFIVRVKSDAPLPEHFAIRVEEALRFLLARSVTPRAIVRHLNIVLTSTTLKSPLIRLGPPISRGSPAFFDRSWDLFGTYLDFVIRKTRKGNWNFCTGYLHMAHEASANSLDAWAIGLSVAVEGLASMLNMEQSKAEKKKREAEKRRLKSSKISS